MKVHKHFDYLTPFSEASDDAELEKIMRLKYPKACSNLEVDAGFFARMVEDVQTYQAWRVIGFDSFEAFCFEKLGKTISEVEDIVNGVKILQAKGHKGKISRSEAAKAMALDPDVKQAPSNGEIGRGRNSSDNVRANSEHGNSAEYIVRRLKRDAPKIAEALSRGEYPSARAAGIAAGIVKKTVSATGVDWYDVLCRAWAKATAKQKDRFMSEKKQEDW